MNRLAWAYCRVSTSKDEQELSLEQQELWARNHASGQDLDIALYCERASAKRTIGRKQFQRMMSELTDLPAARRPSVLLVTSFDRLSRDMTDTLLIARQLKELRVQLFVRDAGGIVKSETFAERAALVGQSMGGEAENEARSNRMRASWERRRREGKPTSNRTPYGLQLRDERDEPAPRSSTWVKKAFAWYASGVGMPTIAKRLKEGAPPHKTLGNRIGPDGSRIVHIHDPVWQPITVKRILVQKRYRGTLIEPELFDLVQTTLASKPRWRHDRKREYPMSAGIRCGQCSRAFHGAAGASASKRPRADGTIAEYVLTPTRYYECTVCSYRINAAWLEKEFRAQIDQLVAHPGDVKRWVQATPYGSTRPELEREITRLEREASDDALEKTQHRVWQLALDATIDAHDLGAQLARVKEDFAKRRSQAATLRQQLSAQATERRTMEQAQGLLRNFWTLYDAATYEDRRELIAALVRALGGATATKDGIVWARQPDQPARTRAAMLSGRTRKRAVAATTSNARAR